MASELERKPAELEEEREDRWGGGAGREDVRRGVAGAMVSPSLPNLSAMRVASLLESTRLPHAEQYRLGSGISLEQEGQRIERRLYHRRPLALGSPITPRTDSPSPARARLRSLGADWKRPRRRRPRWPAEPWL